MKWNYLDYLMQYYSDFANIYNTLYCKWKVVQYTKYNIYIYIGNSIDILSNLSIVYILSNCIPLAYEHHDQHHNYKLTYEHIHAEIYIHARIYIHTRIQTRENTFIFKHIRITHTYADTRAHIRGHVHPHTSYSHTRTCIHAYSYRQQPI